jgi:hypothetical protein
MSNEIMPVPGASVAPFGHGRPGGLATSVNAGAVSVEQERAIAEARGQIQVAQMFPRDVASCRAEFMDECDSIEFATAAIYSIPQAGGKVSGPSIRFAEEVSRCYGHMEYGHRELSRGDGKSEIEVYAWDKQKNNRSIRQITVEHVRDTKDGARKLRDQRDIDNHIANVASKQVRGRILALVPKSFVEAGIARCKATVLGGGGVPLKQRVQRMTDAFMKLGVGAEILKKHLNHSLDTIDAEELVELQAIYNAIKGGEKISEHFTREEETPAADAAAATSAGLKAAAKKGAEAAVKDAAATPPAPAATPVAPPAPAAEKPAAPTPAVEPKPADKPASAPAQASEDEQDIF